MNYLCINFYLDLKFQELYMVEQVLESQQYHIFNY